MEGLMNLRVDLVSGFSQNNPVTPSAHMGVTLQRAKGIDVSSMVCKPWAKWSLDKEAIPTYFLASTSAPHIESENMEQLLMSLHEALERMSCKQRDEKERREEKKTV